MIPLKVFLVIQCHPNMTSTAGATQRTEKTSSQLDVMFRQLGGLCLQGMSFEMSLNELFFTKKY